MASITNLAPTTELEAVNAMLSAIGEAPVATVDDNEDEDVLLVVRTLRNAAREVQAQGWKFNTEFNLPLAPTVASFNWTEPDATTLPIQIYTPPANMATFRVSALPSQVLGSYGQILDLILRPSKQYTAGDPAAPVLVFYDRARNRDGLPVSENRSFIYIDPVWLYDFEFLPETARRYITVLASRRFAQESLGDPQQSAFKQQDELIALRALARDQGLRDTTSLLDNPDTFRAMGGRPYGAGLYLSRRSR